MIPPLLTFTMLWQSRNCPYLLKTYLESGAPSSTKACTSQTLQSFFESIRSQMLEHNGSSISQGDFNEDTFLNYQKAQVMKLAEQCFPQVRQLEAQTIFTMEGETLRELGWIAASATTQASSKKQFTIHKDNWYKELKVLQGLGNACFVFKNLSVQLDFLLVLPDGKYLLILLSPSQRIKDSILQEADFSLFVLKNLGIEVSQIWLMHPNETYVRSDSEEQIDVVQFFAMTPLGQKLKHLGSSISTQLSMQLTQALEANKCDPQAACPYCASVSSAKQMSTDSVQTLHRPGRLVDLLHEEHIYKLSDIQSASLKAKSLLKERHLIQIESVKEQKTYINKASLQEFLNTVQSPFSFLDFESTCEAVPPLMLAKVWEHLPFLFSTHHLVDHTKKSLSSYTNVYDLEDDLVHNDFLIKPQQSRQKGELELVERLIDALPKEGTVFAYGAAFERSIIHRLAQRHSQHRESLVKIANRIVDLQLPFANFWFYHPGQMGRLSLKKILPLIGGRNHSSLAIKSGGDANQAYYELCHPSLAEQKSVSEQEQICEDLKLYCAMDTHGLVSVLHTLFRHVL